MAMERDCEFRNFVTQLGRWFDGMAKFVAIMARHNDNIYTGERLMLERLIRETHKIDKYLKELKNSLQIEEKEILAETVSSLQERILTNMQIGDVLSMSGTDFWQQVLTEEERESLSGLIDPVELQNLCLLDPVRALFATPHLLNCLNNGSMASRLLVAAVNEGLVTVQVGESVMPIVMDGITARIIDSFSLAELLDCDAECSIDIGGFQIIFSTPTVKA